MPPRHDGLFERIANFRPLLNAARLAPFVNLVEVNPKTVPQLGYRLVALQRRQGHLRLEFSTQSSAILFHVPLLHLASYRSRSLT